MALTPVSPVLGVDSPWPRQLPYGYIWKSFIELKLSWTTSHRKALSAQGQTQMQKPEPTRNLLIVHTTDLQDPSDWIAIKQRIEFGAPDVEVRIANNEHCDPSTERWQLRRPSLVFSPIHLRNYVPRGGAVYCGHILSRDEQLRRLSSIGIA